MAYVETHCSLLVGTSGIGKVGFVMLILSLKMCSDPSDPRIFELVKAP